MKKIVTKYTNGEITVVWKPDLCIHATICFTELPDVFVPYDRPWIKMEGASTDEIIDTVSRCPTQAISYFRNDNVSPEKNNEISSPEISIVKNGPYIVKGSVKLVDVDGNEIATDDSFALCRCGKSKNKPFCDGTHNNLDFE
ncbi:MAG: hypothetical protein HGB12_15640 [Bacteroidetes bacterium]|nr:hypothetical protein [Bacteroidota bacterium]